MMRVLSVLMGLISYVLTFWAGGAFALGWVMRDCLGTLTSADVMEILTWPLMVGR